MEKQDIRLFDLWQETVQMLTHEGILLCSLSKDGKPNVMTIGWMTGGVVWGKPILVVYVRPTRFTFQYLEQVPEFTVNVLPPEYAEALQFCGTASGRDVDKFAQTGLKPVSARKVKVPVIEQGVIHYECRIVHKSDLVPENLATELQSVYPQKDYHRIYMGEVLAVYASKDASEKLRRPLY